MKKVALVTGHTSLKGGAVGNMGISEYSFSKKLIEEILKELEDNDFIEAKQFFRVIDREIGYTGKMKELHKRIDKFEADVSISIHFNASSNPSVDGHEVLYCSKKGKELAEKMNRKFNKYLGNKERDVLKRNKKQRGGGFLCNGKSTCILIEPFFASKQHLYIQGGEKRKDLIKSIVEFIKEL